MNKLLIAAVAFFAGAMWSASITRVTNGEPPRLRIFREMDYFAGQKGALELQILDARGELGPVGSGSHVMITRCWLNGKREQWFKDHP